MSYGSAFLNLRGQATPAGNSNASPSTPVTLTPTNTSVPIAIVPQRQFTFNQQLPPVTAQVTQSFASSSPPREGVTSARRNTATQSRSSRTKPKTNRATRSQDKNTKGTHSAEQIASYVLSTLANNRNLTAEDVYKWRCVTGRGRGRNFMSRTLLIHKDGSWKSYKGTEAHNIWGLISGKVAFPRAQQPSQTQTAVVNRETPKSRPLQPTIPTIGGSRSQIVTSAAISSSGTAPRALPAQPPSAPQPKAPAAVSFKSKRVPPPVASSGSVNQSTSRRPKPPPKAKGRASTNAISYRDLGMEWSSSSDEAAEEDESYDSIYDDPDEIMARAGIMDDTSSMGDAEGDEEQEDEWEHLSDFSDVIPSSSANHTVPQKGSTHRQTRIKQEPTLSLLDEDDELINRAVNVKGVRGSYGGAMESLETDSELLELRRKVLELKANRGTVGTANPLTTSLTTSLVAKPPQTFPPLAVSATEVIELSDDDQDAMLVSEVPPKSRTALPSNPNHTHHSGQLSAGSKRPREPIPIDDAQQQSTVPNIHHHTGARNWGPLGTRPLAPTAQNVNAAQLLPTHNSNAYVCVDESLTIADLFLGMAHQQQQAVNALHQDTQRPNPFAPPSAQLVDRNNSSVNRYEEQLNLGGLREYEQEDLMLDPDETLGGYAY